MIIIEGDSTLVFFEMLDELECGSVVIIPLLCHLEIQINKSRINWNLEFVKFQTKSVVKIPMKCYRISTSDHRQFNRFRNNFATISRQFWNDFANILRQLETLLEDLPQFSTILKNSKHIRKASYNQYAMKQLSAQLQQSEFVYFIYFGNASAKNVHKIPIEDRDTFIITHFEGGGADFRVSGKKLCIFRVLGL